MSSELCLYVDLVSQPSRACTIFCRVNNLPVEIKTVNLGKGEHRSPTYLAKNPLGKVPLLQDGDFFLPESCAIMLYLIRKFPSRVPVHWYPPCDPDRALVEAAMNWQHTTVRAGNMKLVFHRVLAPSLGGTKNHSIAQDGLATLKQALKGLETFWLKDNRFMAGQQVSVADLLCCTELEQLHLLVGATEGPGMEEILAPFPGVCRWMADVAAACGAHYQDVHKVLMTVKERYARARIAKM